ERDSVRGQEAQCPTHEGGSVLGFQPIQQLLKDAGHVGCERARGDTRVRGPPASLLEGQSEVEWVAVLGEGAEHLGLLLWRQCPVSLAQPCPAGVVEPS